MINIILYYIILYFWKNKLQMIILIIDAIINARATGGRLLAPLVAVRLVLLLLN